MHTHVAQLREAWLLSFLKLEHGIPSRLTIERNLRLLDPKNFETAFNELMQTIQKSSEGSVVAIDGKACFSKARENGKNSVLYTVGAWCSTNGLSLGQVLVEEKSNEIKAIPELLKLLDLKGAIVTIDAMGCQKDLIDQIVEKKKADYVIGLKKNQPNLHEACQLYAQDCIQDPLCGSLYTKKTTLEKGHGRIDKRTYYLFHDLSWLEHRNDWKGLQGLLMTKSERTVGQSPTTTEYRYYLTSLTDLNQAAFAARKHWGIENNLHWSLDVVFREDQWHTRKEVAAANLAKIRRLTANILKADTTFPEKMTTPIRRYICCADPQVLDRVIFASPFLS